MDYLSAVPEELINEICTHLEKTDLQNLRLCCKPLKEKSLRAFDNEFLGVVRCMITRQSLQKVIDLAKDERFRKAIKELELSLVTCHLCSKSDINADPIMTTKSYVQRQKAMRHKDKTDASKITSYDSRLIQYNKKLVRSRRRLYDRHRHDQNTLRTTGADVELLAEVFRNLPALKKISTTVKYDMRHPPLGAREIYEGTGVWPLHASFEIVMHAVPLVFGALLRSGCQPQLLDLCAVPYNLTIAKTPTSRKLSPTATPAKTFAQSQFDELKLPKLRHLSLQPYSYDSYAMIDYYHQAGDDPLQWVTALLPAMCYVKKLSINGTGNERDRFYWHIWDSGMKQAMRLRNARMLDFLANGNMRLPQLCILEFSHVETNVEQIISILRKHELKRILLDCYTADPTSTVLRALRDGKTLLHADIRTHGLRFTAINQHNHDISSQYVIDGNTTVDFQRELEATIDCHDFINGSHSQNLS